MYGLGAVGIGAMLAAKYLGVQTSAALLLPPPCPHLTSKSTVICVDIVPSRLELALSLGATHTINGRDSDVAAQIKALTPFNAGSMYGVEATGSVAVLKSAHDALANRGHLVR